MASLLCNGMDMYHWSRYFLQIPCISCSRFKRLWDLLTLSWRLTEVLTAANTATVHCWCRSQVFLSAYHSRCHQSHNIGSIPTYCVIFSFRTRMQMLNLKRCIIGEGVGQKCSVNFLVIIVCHLRLLGRGQHTFNCLARRCSTRTQQHSPFLASCCNVIRHELVPKIRK